MARSRYEEERRSILRKRPMHTPGSPRVAKSHNLGDSVAFNLESDTRIKPKRLRTISPRVRGLMRFLRVMAFGLLVLATLAELFGHYRKPIFLPPSWLLPSCHSEAPGSGR